MKHKDIYELMNEMIEKEKVISLFRLAPKLARFSPQWKEYSKERLQGFLVESYFKTLESYCKDEGNNEKSYLERRYSIKSMGIEEAIKQVYKKEGIKPIVFNNPKTKELNQEDKFIFYKDEIELQKYVKSHTKSKLITAIFCNI